MTEIGKKIDALIFADEYSKARELICSALRDEPDDHWLLSRLSVTYYEQFAYEKALENALAALKIAPSCPLVLWGYAGSLEMLDRQNEAIAIYRRLIRRGATKIAYGECGEGLARARGLIADCLYRLGACYEYLGDIQRARNYYAKHLAKRGPGCHSIYSLRDVRREYAGLRQTRRSS